MATGKAKNSAVASPKKSKGTGLRSIIFFAMFSASVIPVGVSSYLAYDGAKADLAASSDATLKRQGQAGAELLDGWVDSNLAALKFMALSQEAVGMDKDKGAEYVKKLQKSAPWFYAFFMIDPEGMQIAKSDDKLNNVSDRAYFKQAMQGSASYQISISKTTNKPAFLPAAPIYSEDKKIVGVFAGGADMDSIAVKITGRKIGKTGYSYLVGADNVILAHPDLGKIGSTADTDVQALDAGGASAVYVDKSLTMKDGVSKSIKRVASQVGNGLKLVSQIDMDEVEAPLGDIRESSLRFLGLAVALAAALAFLLASGISGAIKRLSELSDKLSLAQSEDEVDQIARGIESVGGAREVRALGDSISRLAQSIKLALSAMS